MPRFKLTNGTTTVNFLAHGAAGTLIQSWEPAYATYKGGGFTVDNPLEDGQRLIFKRWEWPVETVDFAIRYNTQAQVIAELRRIEALVQQAVNFWDESHYETDPVWVEARADGEDASRFALVLNGNIVRLPNPFAQPWGMATEGSSTGIMTINFQRTHWQDWGPGVVSDSIAKQVIAYENAPSGSSQFTYSDNIGAIDPQNWIYVGNRLNLHSNISVVRNNGGADVYATLTDYFSTWTVGDTLTFESSTAYSTVVLDVGNPASTALGLAFEYYDGATWQTAINVDDGTAGMTQRGYVRFTTDVDWDTTNFPFRIRLTATNGVASSPGRGDPQFRELAPNGNFGILATDDAGRTAGDIDDLIRLYAVLFAATAERVDRLIIGTRSRSRGVDFKSNISLYQSASWYFVTSALWPTNTFVSWATTYGASVIPLDFFTPSGEGIKHAAPTPGNTITEDAAEIAFTMQIDAAEAYSYRGSFRLLLRCLVGNSDDYQLWRFRGFVNTGSGEVWTKPGKLSYSKPTSLPFETQYVDLGIVSLYGTKTVSIGASNVISIGVKAWTTPEAADTVTYTVPDITFVDATLIPVDEAYLEIAPHDYETRDVALIADSASNPAHMVDTYAEGVDGDNIGPISTVTANQMAVETGEEVGVYFFWSSRIPDGYWADANNNKWNNMLGMMGMDARFVKRFLSFW